ncbi:MAG: hypothetical protein QN182_10470 [Armatimonadota bacterium]|nr:hypothetical protein [Armatimonadota bacterium]
MRRFHQATGVVLGYDETAFPEEGVRRVRAAWKALLPARTMRFLRQDRQAPASVLLSLGAFADPARLREALGLVGSELAGPARRSLCELFESCGKPHPEFQFRWDLQSVMVRGRFVPRNGEELDAALCGLRDLAEELEAAGLPPGASVVVATYQGRWTPHRAHGFDVDSGRARAWKYRNRRWEQEEGG